MISPKSIPSKEEPASDTKAKIGKKKKGYRGETVADRLLASARRMEQERLMESSNATSVQISIEKEQPPSSTNNNPVKLTKEEKLGKATHEIDDLSALEWETSSEQSGL
uniref:BLVR domain-containing protein n=1 Tax=Caenorhabditis tropicalis TaxID=1561998 RepID=A0A1I7UQ26_9PELO